MTGLADMLQQTPLSVIDAPPFDVTFPPLVAAEEVTPVTAVVVTVGATATTSGHPISLNIPSVTGPGSCVETPDEIAYTINLFAVPAKVV